MKKTRLASFVLNKSATLILALCFFLAGCGKSPSGKTTIITTTPSLTASIPTQTPSQAPSATLAPIVTPTPFSISNDKKGGLVLFSQGDGRFNHLFVFGPDSIGLTRLTDGNWDDADPVLSPDGTKIAFTSNKNGYWDIYTLDLHTDTLVQLTNTPTYDGAPSWSPDGQYLVYQTLDGDHLDLFVQSASDPSMTPIQLTANMGNNFEPSWSPDGRTVAFVSDRNSQNEVWLADLQSVDNRFSKLLSTTQTEYLYPRWSPDGSQLAVCKKDSEEHVFVLSPSQPVASMSEVGLGCQPVWARDGTAILATLKQANSTYLVGYQLAEKNYVFAPLQTANQVESLDWVNPQVSEYLINYLNLQELPAPAPLFAPTLTIPTSTAGKISVVPLQDVEAPQAYLSDSADEAFIAIRQAIGEKSGWDFLASLENAYLPISEVDNPGIVQNWLYTGRAIDVNTVPIDAGWMAVSREDYNGQTYWRVWIKCLKQDGSCGQPMLVSTWDFSSRFDSDPIAYENGGKISSIPGGYWIDFTDLAARYGWQRLPSQADWRYYYPGIFFNQFVFSNGLSWSDAMLQLYTPDQIAAIGTVK